MSVCRVRRLFGVFSVTVYKVEGRGGFREYKNFLKLTDASDVPDTSEEIRFLYFQFCGIS